MKKSELHSVENKPKDKFKNFIFNNYHFIVPLIVLIMAAIIVLSAVGANYFPINNEKPADFNDNWKISVDGGEYKDVNIPVDLTEDVKTQIELTNVLPSVLVKGATLLIRTSQQCVSISVDGVVIYSSKNLQNGKDTPSSAYHFVRLPQDSLDKPITIILESPLPNFAGVLNEMQIGSKASLLFGLIGSHGFNFLAGFVLVLVGVFLTVASMFIKRHKHDNGMTFLGCFFISAGIWLAVESRLLQLFVPYPNVLTNLSLFSLTLMPVFMSLYFMTTYFKHYHKALMGMLIAVSAVSFVVFVLGIVNILLPLSLLTFNIVVAAIYVAALLTLIILENRCYKRKMSAAVVGISIFGLFAFLELVFYLINISQYDNSIFLTIGLLIFCFVMFAEFINKYKNAFKSELSVNYLRKLAYTDSLTGLLNRTAFIEALTDISLNKAHKIGVAMFDINNLKTINDENGHLMGDYAIINCASFLHDAFKEHSVYRIGGDEFVAIITLNENQTLEQEMQVVKSWQIGKNSLGMSLEFAYGYVLFSPESDKNLFETVERADKAMYDCKKAQKMLVI